MQLIKLALSGIYFVNLKSSQQGGAIYTENVNVSLTNNTFAFSSSNISGGAIELDCSSTVTYDCSFSVTNNIFTNNYAGVYGGAIAYNSYRPITTSNIFVNNTANSTYGNNTGSYPYYITPIYNLTNTNANTTWPTFSSGNLNTATLYFAVMD